MTLSRAWRTSGAAFGLPSFGWLFTASAVLSLGTWIERTAVGWLVLDETGSVFLTALSWAVRTAPGMVVGPVAGALADRVSRQRLLALATGLKAGVVGIIALLAVSGDPPIVLVFALVAVSGAGMTAGIAAMQPLARDIAGPAQAMNAISLNAFGQRAIGTAGPLIAGFTIEATGTGAALAIAAGVLAVAAVAFLFVRTERRVRAAPAAFRTDLAAGLRLIVRDRTVATLLVLMVLAENLGFSFNALLPSVADEVLDVGAVGFGALVTAMGVGAMIGMLGLAALGDYRYKGRLLAAIVGGFGVLLVGLGLVESFALAMVACVGLGAAMAGVDALEWVLLQSAVDDELRGRAIGAWNFAIGFGWIGPIVLGASASLIGVQGALLASGVVLAVIGVMAARLRSLSTL